MVLAPGLLCLDPASTFEEAETICQLLERELHRAQMRATTRLSSADVAAERPHGRVIHLN